MAYDALSSEQQELLDLLRNELADYVGAEPSDLWDTEQAWQTHFNYLSGQLEHLIRAVQMVGLTGFAASCEFLHRQFLHFTNMPSRKGSAAESHFKEWPVVFLGYLQKVLAKGFTTEAALDLVGYLSSQHWPEPLAVDEREALLQTFDASDVIVDEASASLYPDQITDEQASLIIPSDVRAELLDGLIAELPHQAEGFSAAIEHYIHTSDASYLLTAQRVAHTVKGAANVVGIVGMANLMHYCEDLLETHQKGIDVGGDGFADLLLDAADCLANISDSLQGFSPAPDNVQVLLVQLLRALHGEAAYANPDILQEPPVLDQVHFGELADVKGELPKGEVEISPSEPNREGVKYSPQDESDHFEGDLFGVGDDFSEIDALLADFGSDSKDSLPSEPVDVVCENDEQTGRSPTESKAADRNEFSNELEILSEDGEDRCLIDDDGHLFCDENIDVEDGPASKGSVNLNEIDFSEPRDLIFEGEEKSSDGTTPVRVSLEIAPENPGIAGNRNANVTVDQKPVEELATVTPSASGVDDVKPQFNLIIPDEKATELLRLTGEIQIANTQLLARADTAHEVLKAALRFQSQLIELADDFEKQLAKESAARIAASRDDNVDMDPLELERYNELHTFASRLQEVVTDAQEAVRDADGTMQDLKAIAEDQRQMGFDMQNQVLGVRMLPAGVMASRFSRAVRQASRLTNKPAKFIFEGEDVLVDSRVLHGIADPILHLLRNAVDHGLESTSESRRMKNKSLEGCVRVTFDRVGESVRIQVADDGQGIDYDRIGKLGVARGLLDASKEYGPSELQQVILLPGFSTRDQVTQTSGRGIGLDVVNEQVRQLKGQLQIESNYGQGTQFSISVPMSVMSAHLLLVRSGGRMVGVISRGLKQIVYLQKGDLSQNKDGEWQFLQNDQQMTVYSFDEITQATQGVSLDQCTALLITQKADGQLCAIAVEAIRASEEHVIKPLTRWAYRSEGVTGASILGNGEVVAVVDVHDLPALRYTAQQLEQWNGHRVAHLTSLPIVAKPVALVVDDSLSARRALAQFMADAGYEVISARDGFDAIKLIESATPEIALIDLEMPRMNGLELAAHMRSQTHLKDVPVVMVTSRTTAKHKILAENAGVDRYMNKPWSDDELTETLIAMTNKGSKAAFG